MKVLDGYRHKGMKLEGEISTIPQTYKLEHREGREKMPAGFQATNEVSWTMQVSDLVSEIYKDFLVFDSYMARPTFSVKDPEVHLKEAFQQAGTNATEQLTDECTLLGIDPKRLKIRDWKFSYGAGGSVSNSARNYFGAMGATGPQGMQGSPGIAGSTSYIGGGGPNI